MAATECTHRDQIKSVVPESETCAECLKEGTKPVALRLCLSCGHVGCCDSSVGLHARKHYNATHHPIIESFKSGAEKPEWRYCYIDDTYLEDGTSQST
jgi:uncharacterized UBP type Zn finger protein